MSLRTEAYDGAMAEEGKKTSIKKIAMVTLGVGAVVAAAVAGACFGMDPTTHTLGQYLAIEGSLAVPAFIGGCASLLVAIKGVEAKLSEPKADEWIANEKAETANMTPEQLQARKEKIGGKILQMREKALESENTMNRAVALGTFVSLGS